jgi:hypothetical protein
MIKSALRTFSAFAALGGLISLVWFLLLPSDPKTAWLLGYSFSRWILIAVSLCGFLLFAGLFFAIHKDQVWTERLSVRLADLFAAELWGTLILGSLATIFLFSVTLLCVAYIQFGTSIDKPFRHIVTLTQVYLGRVSPILFWLVLISFVGIVLLARSGFANRVRWFRISSVLAFIYVVIVFEIASKLNDRYIGIFTSEDHPVEWTTFAFMVLAALISWIKAYQARKTGNPYFWFFILFGIACMLFAMEEISWGQRIFKVQTPEFFEKNSDQQEINIHNVINEWFSIRTKQVAAWVMFTYGALLPLLALSRRVRLIFEKFRILVPPLILAFGFAMSSFLTSDSFFGGREEEIAEMFFGVYLFMTILWQFIQPYWPDHQISPSTVSKETT